MQLYRIASSRHPVWDGTGAAILGGRWNSAGQPVIYASVTYAGAMLEVLAHTNTGKVPPSHRCVTADVPDELEITRLDLHSLPFGTVQRRRSLAMNGFEQVEVRFYLFLPF
jgi:RES domain-containing protein